jgi:Zn-dependent protease with chaperone function
VLLRSANAPPANLEFRKSEMLGANALALPGGTVVVTDELVRMMDNDDQVMAVLAHEVGHVAHRHLTRQLLQSSIVAVAASMLLGDVSGISGLAATVPTYLLTASYSRDFEREADAFAVRLLQRTGRSPALYADALERMQKHAEAHEGREPAIAKYLSTHPDTDERIRAARDAAR